MSAPAALSVPAAAAPAPTPKFAALVVGVLGMLGALACLGADIANPSSPARGFTGYLVGLSFWLSIGLGAMFLILLFYIFDAGWSTIVRRTLEHFGAGLPWLGLAMAPLILVPWVAAFLPALKVDPGILWIWLDPSKVLPGGHGTVGEDPLFLNKGAWLSKEWLTIRTILAFGALGAVALGFRHFSFKMDAEGDPKWYRLGRKWAAPAVIALALSATVLAVDYFKTIEYHWFSTMYGVWFFASSVWAGIATTILLLQYLERQGTLAGIIKPAHYYFLGMMLLAFTVFWAYISFSQYFLIYSANIPEVTFWYNIRLLNADGTQPANIFWPNNTWWPVALLLVFGHFVFPFIYLLWYPNKFGAKLTFICGWVLLMHLVDLCWNILPHKILGDIPKGQPIYYQYVPHVAEFAIILGVGGLLAWFFFNSLEKHRAIPIRDPRILESLNHHE